MDAFRPDGTALFWTAEGQGPTVVVSHGGLGDHRLFDPLTRQLVSRGYRVVRWDLRAHGRSSRGAGTATFEDLVDDLRAVLTVSGAERPILVGHDIGGLLSLSVALDGPAIDALALLSVDPALTPMAHRVQSLMLRAAKHLTMRPLLLGLEPMWFRASAHHDTALATLLRRSATTISAASLREMVTAIQGRPDFRNRLQQIDRPVLILWGDRDRLIRPGCGQELLSLLPRAEGGLVADAAHLLYIDRPDEVNEQLMGWIGRVSPSHAL